MYLMTYCNYLQSQCILFCILGWYIIVVITTQLPLLAWEHLSRKFEIDLKENRNTSVKMYVWSGFKSLKFRL